MIFLSKLLKNFIKNFFDLTYYKIVNIIYNSLFLTKKSNLVNCFYSFSYNFQKFNKKSYIDRLYGKAIFKNKKKNFFLISNKKKNLDIYKSNKNLPFFIVNSHISYFEFAKIYFFVFYKLFVLVNFCNSNSRLFLISKKDCSVVLKKLLYDSFCGFMQNSLIESICIKNFCKNKKIKNFICYGEFNGGIRSTYYFLKKYFPEILITNIHHGYANENLLFFNHKRKEFDLRYEQGKDCSPMPDQYLVQGEQFKNILKKYYPKKINIIGCLKYDLIRFKKNKKKKLDKKFKIVVAPSIGDEKDVLLYLKKLIESSKINLQNFIFYLSPHPVIKENTIKNYTKILNKIKFKTPKHKTTLEIIKMSDLLVCGFSTVAYEAALIGKPAIRVIDIHSPILFHIKDEIKKVYNSEDFIYEICKKKFKIPIKEKISNYFYYKLDGNSHKRFWQAIK